MLLAKKCNKRYNNLWEQYFLRKALWNELWWIWDFVLLEKETKTVGQLDIVFNFGCCSNVEQRNWYHSSWCVHPLWLDILSQHKKGEFLCFLLLYIKWVLSWLVFDFQTSYIHLKVNMTSQLTWSIRLSILFIFCLVSHVKVN